MPYLEILQKYDAEFFDEKSNKKKIEKKNEIIRKRRQIKKN